MADETVKDNIVIVNAPAGSGKTYRIKAELSNYILENPQDKILCITYTNRAANELLKDIDSPNVYVSTIHSYINNMISPVLSKKEIIDLYFESYGEQIKSRMSDEEKKESNKNYIEKYGSLNLETIRSNIRTLSYNETQFNSLYYGGLSHNDLLTFTFMIIKKYPKLYQKINRRFKQIIIDEYQDTSPEVLELFINAVQGTDVKLYLYGDKMQQIYKSYSVKLNEKLSSLKHDDKKIINHRSIPVIVDILNNIYNRKELNQGYFDELKDISPEYKPRIIIRKTSDFSNIIKKIISQDNNTLTLYIFNKERFKQIGAANLYEKVEKTKKYGFGKHFSVADILLNNDEYDNPDELFKFMIIMYKANNYWNKENYGSFLKICRDNKRIFHAENLSLNSMNDKKILKSIWKDAFQMFNKQEATIGQLIELMNSKNLLCNNFIEVINTDDIYMDVFKVCISEIIALENSNSKPNVSTQHGVKGESHESVIFVAEDSKNTPFVYMYDFFKIWSLVNFSLDEFEEFNFKYVTFCNKVKSEFDFKLNKINKDQNKDNKLYLFKKCEEINKHFVDNDIFKIYCKDKYDRYLSKQTVDNAKKCFNDNPVANVLSAYKLFYVGCSRARKNLTVLIDEEKLVGFRNEFIKKSEQVGFKIDVPKADKPNVI